MSSTRPSTDSAPARRVTPPEAGASKNNSPAKMPPRRTWLWFLLVIVANYFLVRSLMPGGESSVTVPYTLFKQEVTKGNVQAIYSRADVITGKFKSPVTYPPPSAVPSSRPTVARSRPRSAI